MIIRELEFHNFLRFLGTSTLTLDCGKNSASTLTLILAPNDSGKTSLIRGLEFLFYGTVDGKGSDQVMAALVNDEAVRTTRGAAVSGYVQATFASRGAEFTLRRSIAIRPDGRSDRTLKSVTLASLEGAEGREQWRSDQNEVLEYKLERLMPKSLFQYFFFQGEGLAETLIERQDPRIREGLTELLHEDDWQEAIDDARYVLSDLTRDCQRESGQDQALKQAVENLGSAEEAVSSRKKDLEKQEAFLTAATAKVVDLTSAIAESIGTVDRESAAKLQNVERELQQHRNRLSAARTGLLSSIGNTRGLPFLKKAFQPVQGVLEELRKQNLLPADVSEGFIGRILKAETCICGCDLTVGSPSRERVERFRQASLSNELNADLFQLYNLLEPGSARGFETEIEQSLIVFGKSSEFIDSEGRAIAKLEGQVKALQSKVDEAAQERCEQLLRDQHKAIEQQKSQALRAQEARFKLESATKYKEAAKKALDKLRASTRGSSPDTAFAKRDLASDLVELLESGLEALKSSLHDPLEETLSELYDPVAKDGSEARISPTTLLPYIEKGGKRATFLGGGQKQVLCLAYIMALAQLRKTLHHSLRGAGVMVPAADDQAFVMDSIFGQCEPEYQEAICNFLPGRTGQILLLLAGQQWTETVRQVLEKEVDLLFGFEYHSPNARYDESKHQFVVGQKVHRLLKNVSGDETAYTVIKKLPT